MPNFTKYTTLLLAGSLLFSLGAPLRADEALWTKDFNDKKMKVIRIEALPEGYALVTTEKPVSRKQFDKHLWLIEGKTGTAMWDGPSDGGSVFSVKPLPIVVTQGPEGMVMTAYTRDGGKAWSKTFDFVGLSIALDERQREFVVFAAPKAWWNNTGAQSGLLVVLSLTGEDKWRVALDRLELPALVRPDVLSVTDRSVWIAAGGKAIHVDRALQKVTFNESFKVQLGKNVSPFIQWAATDEAASVALGDTTVYMEAGKGIQWSHSLQNDKLYPHAIAMTPEAVVTNLRLFRKERQPVILLAMDRKTGREKWRFEKNDGLWAKWERVSAPPTGMAVGEGRVVVSVDNSLVGFDLETGKPAYTIDLSKAEYTYAKRVERWKDRFVLFGSFQIRSHRLKDGQSLWHHEEIRSPQFFAMHMRRKWSGMAGGMMGAAADLQSFYAQSMSSLANTKVAGATGSKRSDYILSPSARYQMTAASQGGARSAAWINAAAAASQSSSQALVEALHYHESPGQHVQLDIHDNKLAFASVVLMDLESGKYHEGAVSPKATAGCVPVMAADVPSGLVYVTAYADGLACTGYRKVTAVQGPGPKL